MRLGDRGKAETEVFTPKYIPALQGAKETAAKSRDTKGHFQPLRKSSVTGSTVSPPCPPSSHFAVLLPSTAACDYCLEVGPLKHKLG